MHCGEIKKLTSEYGHTYLGIQVETKIVEKHLKVLKYTIGKSEFAKFSKNLKNRDGSIFHLTVVSPIEFAKLAKKKHKLLINKTVFYALTGLGNQSRNTNRIYYATARSPQGEYLREQIGLPKKDLHITLGFNAEDIHDIPKDENTHIRTFGL